MSLRGRCSRRRDLSYWNDMDAALILDRLESAAAGFERLLNRRLAAFLAGYTVLYFASTIWLASLKRLWSDELATYYLSTQASADGFWAALKTGIDSQPPPFFLITRLAAQLGVDPQISVRLPEIIAFWVMSLLLFRYVA